ncbi:MAG: 30S ribosomal protein S12 methylthiotransferase RimO [Lachnospiraceae bacterium]|jgi:ribosomal protein S12 methylthiotransferase|uniref:30S ribosomal protein S12 methylthiotransferase RimO n=1 Tax=Coprococcus hominis (ex Arizal et al. 2022) TaxID=2881262 RepID=UPI000335D816|nr:ribosomal protein S12 methylthiotransferase RimO [Clostridium sp. CAG:127]HCS97225.1 30S ribosomal protein S12 methylthiotransferase RimO [Lachnospiraceae bacterium]
MNILMVSLGCDKNLCDSEAMLGLLAKHNYNITNDEQEADAIIVNTCSFIKDAMEESVNTVLEMAKLKQQNLKYLIVTGCMAQRFKDEIFDEIPEIDACLGTSSFDKILDVIEELKARDGIEDAEEISVYDDIDRLATITESNKVITSGTFMGYLKIAEGCDKFCTYCVIPHIRGHYRSVPMEQLLKEAEYMASQGIEELVLVAQETTCYGKDLYGEKRLHVLVRELAKIDGIKWIRLMYCYPEEIYDELIDCFKEEPKLLHYIDMPMQHSEDAILKRMGRRTDCASIEAVIGKLREAAPDIAIRTSLIAGFPGETQEEHEALMAFLDEQELDRVGVFTYSREDGTPAATFENQIDEETAEQWRNEIMELQQEISLDKNETFVGKIMQVIIEGYSSDDDVYVGRTYRDAPGVDGLVFVNCDYELMSGQIVDVRINEVGPYDMIGGIVDESAE